MTFVDPAGRCDTGVNAEVLRNRGEQSVEAPVTCEPGLPRNQQQQRVAVLVRAAEELEHQAHAPPIVARRTNMRGQVSEAEQPRVGFERQAEPVTRRAV